MKIFVVYLRLYEHDDPLIISVAIDPHFVHIFPGVCYRTLGRVHEAEHQFKLALALNPTYYSAVFNLGLTYQHLNRWDEAIQHFRAVTKVCNFMLLRVRMLAFCTKVYGYVYMWVIECVTW